MLRCTAEKGLQDRIWRSADPFLITHAQQGGKRTCYCPKKTHTYLSEKTDMMQRGRLTAAGSSPLKYLPENQEADSDGYANPQIRQFGEYFSLMVGQISPAVALREPDPVCPHRLA